MRRASRTGASGADEHAALRTRARVCLPHHTADTDPQHGMPPDTRTLPTPPHRSLQAWREALLAVRLPLLSNEDALTRLLAPGISLGQVQALAEADPPLALDLLAMAAREPRLQDGVRSLQQAVAVLGTQRTQALVRARQARPAPPHATAQQLARQAMATSALAALFVQAWGRQRRAGDTDHRQWLARLMGVARWKLPWVDPALAQRIETRVAAGERRPQVERELLGFDVPTLNAWHLQDLGFGEAADLRHGHLLPTHQVAQAARLGWTGPTAPDVPLALARVLHQPTTGCALAYALALELQTGWYSERARHWMAVASAHLGQPLDRVRHDLVQTALFAAQDAPLHHGLTATAARLLWPPDPRPKPLPAATVIAAAPRAPKPAQATRPPQATAPTPAKSPIRDARAAAAPPVPAAPAAPDFEQRCESAAFESLATFMREALTHLHQDMGLTRCALFLKQAGRDELVCYVAHGFATPVSARAIVLPLQADGVLTRLMQHPTATLWIKPHQVPTSRKRLPPALSEWINDTGCLLGTVQVRGRAMGLWWADVDPHSAPIDAQRLAQFGRMTQVFGAEFTRLLHLQRSQAQVAPALR